jgi:hypothetical protein
LSAKSIPQYSFIALLLLVDWPPDEPNSLVRRKSLLDNHHVIFAVAGLEWRPRLILRTGDEPFLAALGQEVLQTLDLSGLFLRLFDAPLEMFLAGCALLRRVIPPWGGESPSSAHQGQ